jgi:hypothetical protein
MYMLLKTSAPIGTISSFWLGLTWMWYLLQSSHIGQNCVEKVNAVTGLCQCGNIHIMCRIIICGMGGRIGVV